MPVPGKGGGTPYDAEKALRDYIPFPYQSLNAGGEIIAVNTAWSDLLGYPPSEAEGEWFGKFLGEDSRDRFESLLERLKSDGTLPNEELTLVDAEGALRPVSVDGTVEFDEGGEPIRCHCQLREISGVYRQREQLELMEHAVESALNGIVIADLEGEILSANSAFLDLWGYESETEVRERSVTEFWEDPDQAAQVAAEVLTTGDWDGVLVGQRKDGSTFEARSSASIVTDSEGSELAMMAVFEDITESRKQQKEIRRERKRFKSIFAESFDAMVIADDEGQYIDANESAEKVFGLPKGELLGRSVAEFTPDDFDFEAAWQEFQQSKEDRGSLPLLQPDGTERIVEYAATSDIVPGQHLLILRDITERKRHEDAVTALHEAALRFGKTETRDEIYDVLVDTAEEILDFALVAVDIRQGDALVQQAWSLDEDTDGYYARTLLEKDTLATRAYTRGETILADDLRDYDITPADPEYLSALTVPIGDIGTFQTVARETQGFDEKDRELAELLVGHAHEALQRLEHAESVQQQRQRLQRENDRLETMAGIISHDLRNPLNVAGGNVELAMEECESSRLDASMEAIQRMSDLIEDVLTWARAGANVSEDEMTRVSLREMAETCWQNVETGKATIEVTGDPSIFADKSRLQHVFENLYRNAVEHVGTDVTIRVGELEDGFYVEDDGPGIPQEDRPKVFEYGYSTAEEGTGFGLNIVQEIVEAHVWNIHLTDGSEGGARFEITGVEFAE